MQKPLRSIRGATRWSLWSVRLCVRRLAGEGGGWSRLIWWVLFSPRICSGPELQRYQRGISGQRVRGARQQRGDAESGHFLNIHARKCGIVSEAPTFPHFVPAGQRALGGSAPVNIPGSLARSSSFNSSSSLSTSPLSSLSQSLSQSLLSAAVAQQNQQSSVLAKQELGLRGTPTSSSQNSLGTLLPRPFTGARGQGDKHLSLPVWSLPGLNGGASSIWDFVSGSFSPSPSPVFSSLTSTSSSGDLARLFRDLDEAKKKLKQWEEAWLQVKQVSSFQWTFLNARFSRQT